MIEFVKRELRIKLDGQEYTLVYPSNRKLQEHSIAVKGLEEDKVLDALVNFLDKLGLPKDIAWEMEPYMLEEILTELTSKKK